MKRYLQIIVACFLIHLSGKVFAQCTLSGEITGDTTICNGGSADLTVEFTDGTSPYTFTYDDGSPHTISNVTSPYTLNTGMLISTTIYTLTDVTDADDCTGSVTGSPQMVTVLNPVDFGTISNGDEVFCDTGNPSNITLSTQPSGGSGTFTYQWYLKDGVTDLCPSGTDVTGWTMIGGQTNNSYNPPAGLFISRTYAVQVDATGSPDCGVATWASSCRKVTVNSLLTPAVSVSVLPSDNVCEGAYTTFVADASNTGGGSVNYDFKVNNVSQQSSSSNVYVTNSLVNNDAVTCDITVTGGVCLAMNVASSNTISMVVNSSFTPSVSVAASASVICDGTNATFIATAADTGGGSVNYNFMVNNISVQNESSNSFSSTSLVNGDEVKCEISVTNGTCLTSSTASSNIISMVVNPNITPAVSIVVLPGNTVCEDTYVTFAATANNSGGGLVTYNFKVNNVSKQDGASNVYVTNSLSNNDLVTCEITVTGGTCLTGTTAESNTILMMVNSNNIPSVSISVSPSDTICQGKKVKFTASTSNTDSGSVKYNFKVNNVSKQDSTTNIFKTNLLSNNDFVTCEITITGGVCLVSNMALSNIILMTVNSSLTPSVSISVAPDDTICAGTSVTFTAMPENTGGGAVTYNFKINNISVQNADTNVYSVDTLTGNDTVTCEIKDVGETCLTDSMASSNEIPITVFQNSTPSVSIIPTDDTICDGIIDTFTATPANTGGGLVSYNFKVNNNSAQDGNDNIYSTDTLINGDVVTCEITVANGMCLFSPTATSNAISMTVNPNITPEVSISVSPNDTVCAGTAVTFTASTTNTGGGIVTYKFKVNNNTVQDSTENTFTTSTLSDSDKVKCEITVTDGTCLDTNKVTSQHISMTINPIPTVDSVASITLCSGETSNTITFISQQQDSSFYWSGTLNIGFGISGQDSIQSFVALNPDTVPIVNTISVYAIAKGCTGNDSTFFTITINPNIDFTSPHIAPPVCDSAVFFYDASSSPTNGVTFSWIRDSVYGISNAPGTATSDSIYEWLDNTTDSPIVVKYIFTLLYEDSCSQTDALYVTVNPTPTLSSSLADTVCSETAFFYSASSDVPNVIFSWQRDAVNGISNDSAYGTNAINDTLINTTDTSIIVTYDFTLQIDACLNHQSLQVTVNPKPKVDSIGNFFYCNGDIIGGISFSSPSPDSSFFWSNSDTTIGLGASGDSSIAGFVAENIGNTTKNATITVYAMANGCRGDDRTFTITVNPSPPVPLFTILGSSTDTIFCGGPENVNFNVTNPTSNVTYHWFTDSPGVVDIRNETNPNTVISFKNVTATVEITVYATNDSLLGACIDSASQIIILNDIIDSIQERKIILKQPGNLLVYPDNTMAPDTGYQWGYDELINDTTLGPPHDILNQVYQVFVPPSNFLTGAIPNQELNTTNYCYWVLLQKDGCRSKVYYNGPYAGKPIEDSITDLNGVSVFPNPTSGSFSISLYGEIFGTIEVKMYNTLSQEVYSTSFRKNKYESILSIGELHLTNGIYYLELSSSNHQKFTKRIVISN